MKDRRGEASRLRDQAHELRAELARKIASFIGSAENRATEIPGLTLYRRTAPTAPCSMTYQPSVTVIAQGRKRVELGRNVFIYDASRFLLTSVDLPVVSRGIEASEEVPCLALSLKLEMPVVRELLSREEIQVGEAPSDSPGMATGVTTVPFLSACCRLVDLLDTPQDIPFLGGLIQREIIYRILGSAEGARLRAIATLGEQSHRTAKAVSPFALPPVNFCQPVTSYTPASARFRMSAVAAADSSRVYASLCDGGSVSIINTTTSSIATGGTNTPDPLVTDLLAPFSAAPAQSGQEPPPQNPVFLLIGQ